MAEHYLYGTAPVATNPSRVLLVKILNALGGGGSGGSGGLIGSGVTGGAGVPSAAPSNPAIFWTYYNTNDGTAFYWNPATATWN